MFKKKGRKPRYRPKQGKEIKELKKIEIKKPPRKKVCVFRGKSKKPHAIDQKKRKDPRHSQKKNNRKK